MATRNPKRKADVPVVDTTTTAVAMTDAPDRPKVPIKKAKCLTNAERYPLHLGLMVTSPERIRLIYMIIPVGPLAGMIDDYCIPMAETFFRESRDEYEQGRFGATLHDGYPDTKNSSVELADECNIALNRMGELSKVYGTNTGRFWHRIHLPYPVLQWSVATVVFSTIGDAEEQFIEKLVNAIKEHELKAITFYVQNFDIIASPSKFARAFYKLCDANLHVSKLFDGVYANIHVGKLFDGVYSASTFKSWLHLYDIVTDYGLPTIYGLELIPELVRLVCVQIWKSDPIACRNAALEVTGFHSDRILFPMITIDESDIYEAKAKMGPLRWNQVYITS